MAESEKKDATLAVDVRGVLGKEGHCEAQGGLERGFAFLAKCEK